MLVFRSEAHITAWLDGRTPGATLTLPELARLSHAWWATRLAPDWRPRTREESQAILDGFGLTGPFWRLG